jgi:streptogramin lyase
MVRIALTTAFVASLAVAAIATPVQTVHTVPLKKVAKVTSSKALFESDLRRFKAGATSSGAVENDLVSYTAPVKIGSQTFDLIVDTGSSNTWVGANTAFSAGSTGKSTGKSVSVSYGSGSFSGTEYTESVIT